MPIPDRQPMMPVEMTPHRSLRDALVAGVLAFLGRADLLPPADVRAVLEREIDAAGPDALIALHGRLGADEGWAYYPPDPLARRIHHLLADRFLDRGSRLVGAGHAAAVAGAPVAIFANHLSYADANVVEGLLQRAGCDALADRLTAIAGPKVFSSRERRFSSLCFGTVKVPQSAEVSSGEAQLAARDVARAAREAIEAARRRLAAGDALLLFGEGTRSRTVSMQPLLSGVWRYLDVAGTLVVPAGLTGPEALFPVDAPSVRPARVTVTLGPPMRADALLERAGGNRRTAVDAVGLAIASLLPAPYRGVYADADRYQAARAVLEAFRREDGDGRTG